MRQPTISVVIRTLNEGRTLGAVLDALAAQSIVPNEIIVVDDGSTDATTTIAQEHGAKVIELPAGTFSYGRALNIGFAASTSQVVGALSGHAVPRSPHWLQNLVANFEDPRVAAVASRLMITPRSKLHNYWLHIPFLIYHKRRKNHLWLFWNTAAAYRRNVWERFPFNEAVPGCEDRDWAIRVLSNDWKVMYEPQATVWHAHDESYTRFFKRMFMVSRMMNRMDNDRNLRKKAQQAGPVFMFEE